MNSYILHYIYIFHTIYQNSTAMYCHKTSTSVFEIEIKTQNRKKAILTGPFVCTVYIHVINND